ncbi:MULTISPECIES: TIM barrel protein [unclassified Rhizobium]|uniref:TIM barrel protein n=1 Tax=unclassified Rhizobium TaxID=2613769 RepID=UPI00146E0293|nr:MULTISPECIES: TIM barrel protein [unclassified Rhizobium]MBB3285180.1 2-keto-myo-inositol isomerase [Rhizobium sp. BK252]MBB3399919.1 2-keto-myo-inositol isomerase [Rhizobium sp. BK289]MBB3412499.1 2-keto-myo-inositol isomerase [Rhizobium sp. BK284]MBB3480385.1 2-keto-myo-inositol isomerase [Rhizobium sp. BK347]MDK4719058.1 TIM barrel protein [Rhizobium sp. CNPSo 3968]
MSSIRFALNHMCAPSLTLEAFFAVAKELGIDKVEIRNDLAGNAILDGTPAMAVKELAAREGVAIISINALQRFNEWNDERAREAAELIDYARDCGARALVLVPVNDGSGREPEVRRANLRKSLSALKPMLEAAGIIGLVEPLGFEICSLRLKSEAAAAIEELGAKSTFCLVHDTFHHHLAGEAAIFPELTGLIHISGVSDPDVSVADMRDPHRVLVDARDRLDNVGQLRALIAAGYAGPASFEPFAPTVHALNEPIAALKESMAYIAGRL